MNDPGKTHYIGDGCKPPHESVIPLRNLTNEEYIEFMAAIREGREDAEVARLREALDEREAELTVYQRKLEEVWAEVKELRGLLAQAEGLLTPHGVLLVPMNDGAREWKGTGAIED